MSSESSRLTIVDLESGLLSNLCEVERNGISNRADQGRFR